MANTPFLFKLLFISLTEVTAVCALGSYFKFFDEFAIWAELLSFFYTADSNIIYFYFYFYFYLSFSLSFYISF
jgi:hypothetical protein